MNNPEISTRLNIIIDNELLGMIDAESKRMGMNRSAVIRYACRQYLQSQKAIQSLTDMVDAYKAEQMRKAIEGESSVFRNPNK